MQLHHPEPTALAFRISHVSCAGKGLRQSSLFLNIARVTGDAMAILRNAYIAMAQLKCNKVARPLLLVPHAPRHHSCTPQWFQLCKESIVPSDFQLGNAVRGTFQRSLQVGSGWLWFKIPLNLLTSLTSHGRNDFFSSIFFLPSLCLRTPHWHCPHFACARVPHSKEPRAGCGFAPECETQKEPTAHQNVES